MSKPDHGASMYESIPAVAELNKVSGFDPFKLLRPVRSSENGETVLQLTCLTKNCGSGWRIRRAASP